MTKLSVIFFIMKQRIPNIFLVSIVFSSLIVIFMVGLGVKNIFYDYLQSDYGNIPDVKVQLNNLSNKKIDKLNNEIKTTFANKQLDTLVGYEFIDKVSIVDSEDLLLTDGLPLFVKAIKFSNKLNLLIDGKTVSLDVVKISYVDDFFVELDLKNLKIQNINSVQFLSLGKPIKYDFCKKIYIENNHLIVKAIPCRTKADELLDILKKDDAKTLKVETDGDVFPTKIIFVDDYYKSLVVKPHSSKPIEKMSLAYKNIEISNDMIENFDLEDGELIINFYQDTKLEKNYKLFLSKILRDFINYKRMVLKLHLHSFANDTADDKEDPLMVYLNELTDLIDMIFAKDMGNLAVSSTFLAQDLNNFGILDNFTIKTDNYQYTINIRSTIEYNPERLYDKNILIINHNILKDSIGKENINNFVDIYGDFDEDDIATLGSIVKKYDPTYKILKQSDIIPSIKPKKFLFDTTVIVIAVFILGILFIAMYIVLLQFYANFNSELSLLKLYGSKITYQAVINFISFLISAGINYLFLVHEEGVINHIMQKYFFTEYHISMTDYFISLGILFVYIVINYFMEYSQIKKLNLIQGQ